MDLYESWARHDAIVAFLQFKQMQVEVRSTSGEAANALKARLASEEATLNTIQSQARQALDREALVSQPLPRRRLTYLYPY